jgi:hypothetical protein
MILSILGFLAASLSVADPQPNGKERLVMEPYPDTQVWTEVTHDTAGAKFLIERVPSGQTFRNYKDILSAQSFPDQRGVDPSKALKGIFQLAGGSCDSVRVNGPKAQVEGGYNVAYGQVYCGRQRGKSFGVNMFYKIIQGNDAQYVVLRERRVPPSAVAGIQSFTKEQFAAAMEEMKSAATANSYLVESVYLCGASSAEARCSAHAPS